MSTPPPYPADFNGQVEWYKEYEGTLSTCISRIQDAFDNYILYPNSRNLNKTYCNIKELAEECDQWIAAAIALVRSSKNSTPDEILDWLQKMALIYQPRTLAVRQLYAYIERLYRAALPPIPFTEFIPAEGQEGFCIM